MEFRRIYDSGLAQASYLVGCQATGEAIIVDPTRDIDRYLDLVRAMGFELRGVAETHIHADFVSGARELAAATGARLYLSGEHAVGWEYSGLDELDVAMLRHGDLFEVGAVEFKAVHTPGHTPEHISFLVTDTARSTQPLLMLTGDFLFVGDLGRPDLLETATGAVGTAKMGAMDQHRSLRDRIMGLAEGVQIWPGHGAGSACGAALGAIASTTVGYERHNAWWRRFFAADGPSQEAFVDRLLAAQPEPPRYFSRMKRLNRDGPRALGAAPKPARLLPGRVAELRRQGARFVDLRGVGAYAEGHIPGSYHLPDLNHISTHAGWVLEAEARQPIILIGCDEALAEAAARRLVRVGQDEIAGYVEHLDEVGRGLLKGWPVIDARGAHAHWQAGDSLLIDVRSRAEYDREHIPGALHRHYGRIDEQSEDLPRERLLVIHCASGNRASVAAAVLARQGFERLAVVSEGVSEWLRAGYPVE